MRPVLVLNAGSSSLKFALYDRQCLMLARGQAAGIGGHGQLRVESKGTRHTAALPDLTPQTAREAVFGWLGQAGHKGFAGVGHRIVHGGTQFTGPSLMDDKAIAAMRTMRVECQLHLPFELDMLEAARAMLPGVPQVACFDTAFHAGQPESATRLPLPDDYWRKGYRRFGFHGLNYQHVAETLAPAPARTIIAHLGAGASLCALQDGKSIATTMGYSTLDGLIMATRPGSLDPGVLLALMKFEGMGHDELECLLYRDSGLKGLSGLSGDMQVLLASSDPRARLAVEIYCQSIARHVAGLTVALGGLDLLAFTGGVGENAAPIRDRVTGLLAHLGKFATRVIAADEERVIAEQTWGLI